MTAHAASYQMYAWPQTAAAANRFWQFIRTEYGAGDSDLTDYPDAAAAWGDPALLFSQTCGLPYRTWLHGKVQLLGTLDYAVPGCPPGYYRSCLVVRRDNPRRRIGDFAGARLARNSAHSQSGWAAVVTHLAESGSAFDLRANLLDTGSHACSVRTVAEAKADLASIDAVTWRFLKRYEPAAKELRVLLRTRPTPGLPLITGLGVDPDPLFEAIAGAIAKLTTRDRRTLGVRGIVRIPDRAYLAEPLPHTLAPGPVA